MKNRLSIQNPLYITVDSTIELAKFQRNVTIIMWLDATFLSLPKEGENKAIWVNKVPLYSYSKSFNRLEGKTD